MRKIILAGKYALLCETKFDSFKAALDIHPPYGFRIPSMAEMREIHRKSKDYLGRWYDETKMPTDMLIYTSKVKMFGGRLNTAALHYNTGEGIWTDYNDHANGCYLFICNSNMLQGEYNIVW